MDDAARIAARRLAKRYVNKYDLTPVRVRSVERVDGGVPGLVTDYEATGTRGRHPETIRIRFSVYSQRGHENALRLQRWAHGEGERFGS